MIKSFGWSAVRATQNLSGLRAACMDALGTDTAADDIYESVMGSSEDPGANLFEMDDGEEFPSEESYPKLGDKSWETTPSSSPPMLQGSAPYIEHDNRSIPLRSPPAEVAPKSVTPVPDSPTETVIRLPGGYVDPLILGCLLQGSPGPITISGAAMKATGDHVIYQGARLADNPPDRFFQVVCDGLVDGALRRMARIVLNELQVRDMTPPGSWQGDEVEDRSQALAEVEPLPSLEREESRPVEEEDRRSESDSRASTSDGEEVGSDEKYLYPSSILGKPLNAVPVSRLTPGDPNPSLAEALLAYKKLFPGLSGLLSATKSTLK